MAGCTAKLGEKKPKDSLEDWVKRDLGAQAQKDITQQEEDEKKDCDDGEGWQLEAVWNVQRTGKASDVLFLVASESSHVITSESGS